MGIVTGSIARGPRGVQEDRFTTLSLRDGWLLAVFDGHNGSAVSDFCAGRLPKLASEMWKKPQTNKGECYFLRAIIEALHKETADQVAGSTISLAHVSEDDGRVDIAVLGDSPVVVRSKNLSWVSIEHNIRSNLNDVTIIKSRDGDIDHGYLCVDDEEGYLTRCLQLTRALGDTYFNKYILREPACSSFPLDDESVVAIMSDGVYDSKLICGPDDLLQLSVQNAREVVNDALKRGTRDNVTAVVWRA